MRKNVIGKLFLKYNFIFFNEHLFLKLNIVLNIYLKDIFMRS